MRRLLTNSVFWFVIVLAFVSGVALLGLAAWLQPMADAERDRRGGNQERALERYSAGEARFDRLPWTRQSLRTFYQTSQSNVFWLLYQRKDYDAIIEKAEASPSFPSAHYWAGCSFFAKAIAENKLDRRTGWFRRAEEEFRRALELDPADWDSKFNYEIARRVRNMAQKQPNTPPAEFLKLLRPQPGIEKAPGKRTG